MFNYSSLPESLQHLLNDYESSKCKDVAQEILNSFDKFQDLQVLIDLYEFHSEFFEEDDLTHQLCVRCNTAQIKNILNVAANHVVDQRNCLALLGYHIIGTTHEIDMVKFISKENPNIFDELVSIGNENVEDADSFQATQDTQDSQIDETQEQEYHQNTQREKDRYLITWILFEAKNIVAVQSALSTYFRAREASSDQDQQNRAEEMIDYILNERDNNTAIIRYLDFFKNHLNREIIEYGSLTKEVKNCFSVFEKFVTALLTMISEVDSRAGWSNLDPTEINDDIKNDLKKMAKYLSLFCSLIAYNFMDAELQSIEEQCGSLLQKARAEVLVIPDDGWGDGDNPIEKLENLVRTINQFNKIKGTYAALINIAQNQYIQKLEVEAVKSILSEKQLGFAKAIFDAMNKLLSSVYSVEGSNQQFPDFDVTDEQIQAVRTPFIEAPILSLQYFYLLKDFMKTLGRDLTMQHRKHSGPKAVKWEKEPDDQKYVTAIKEQNGFEFIALPLVIQYSQEDDRLTLEEKVELALLTSLFYHLKRAQWKSEVCSELRKIIGKLNSEILLNTPVETYRQRYRALEQKDYYAECLSEDSESEHIEEFSRESIRVQNALLTSAEQMAQRGQVDAIWTKDRKKLREPVYPKAQIENMIDESTYDLSKFTLNCYDLTRRAEIQHDEQPPASVINDLSLLNEHAIKGTLTLQALQELSSTFYISQYRGIHYNENIWAQDRRQKDRKTRNSNYLHYTPAVFKKAQVDLFSYIEELSEPDRQNLLRNGELLKHQLNCLDFTGSLESNLSNQKEAVVFTTATDATQDLYTKKYDDHRETCERIQNKKEKQVLLDNALDVAMLYTVGGENYVHSTGDTPYHALQYAFGLKNYSFKGTLSPKWHVNGQPERPYVGKVYVMLFDLPAYLKANPRHLVSLNYHRRVAIDVRILPERESSFTAYIPKENVIEQTVIRFPNFSCENYSPYYQHKYGISETLYREFRKKLVSSVPESLERKKIEYLIIEHICAFQEACLIEDARQIAKRKGAWLIYRDRTGGFSLVPPRLMPTNASGDQALAQRQATELEKRKSQKPAGWLHKLMQDKKVLPGINYTVVLKRLLPRLKDHMTSEDLISEGGFLEAEWLAHINVEAKSGFVGFVKEYFQDILNKLLGIAKSANLQIVIKSFLFSKDININPGTGGEVIELLYLGGDGFHGLVPKDWLSEAVQLPAGEIELADSSEGTDLIDIGQNLEGSAAAMDVTMRSSMASHSDSGRAKHAADDGDPNVSAAFQHIPKRKKQSSLTNFFHTPSSGGSHINESQQPRLKNKI